MRLREAGWTEERAQKAIAADAEQIGIPSTWTVLQERAQGGPRVDIAFISPDARSRVLVELQQGGADRNHVIKVLEYLHREKTAAPDAHCRAILIAESFSGIYGRLVEAIARVAPLQLFRMAISRGAQEDRLQVDEHFPAALREAAAELPDHEAQWRAKQWFPLVEALYLPLMAVDPEWTPKFNQSFIGGGKHGGHFNYFGIHDGGRGKFHLELKLDRSDKVDIGLAKAGFEFRYMNAGQYAGERRRHYRLTISNDRQLEEMQLLVPFLLQARQRWGGLKPAVNGAASAVCSADAIVRSSARNRQRRP